MPYGIPYGILQRNWELEIRKEESFNRKTLFPPPPVREGTPGLIPEFTSYTAMETTLLPQTTLFLFTDGLTEAKNTEKLMFGDDHTLQVATRLQQEQLLEPKQVVTSMNDAVKAFVGEAEQSDDLTMLAIPLPNCLQSHVL